MRKPFAILILTALLAALALATGPTLPPDDYDDPEPPKMLSA